MSNQEMLDSLQRDTFRYFVAEANPTNGLIPDNTRTDAPCSIAAVGMALTCLPVGVERGWITRDDAIRRVLTTLRFFRDAPHTAAPNATGYHGFYYHFLDMTTGQRARKSELSTIDTSLLIAGALLAAQYFNHEDPDEIEIRRIVEALYRRINWAWALNDGETVSHGWTPERGFLRFRWAGYNEALLLYLLALGSPTHPIPEASYAAWTRGYRWKQMYGIEFLYAGPLFIHQLPHMWIDFRGMQDAYMRDKDSDYFENSRRATQVQQAYAIRNPKGFRGYGEHTWGITASDGPGPATRTIDGVERQFHDYRARGVPFGLDDGTLAPWAVAASLPFAPEVVLPTLEYLNRHVPEMTSTYGFKCSFNPTFPGGGNGWISSGYYGLDQGPVVAMIENYRSELPWRLMRNCRYLETGLARAGFTGGWLDEVEELR